MSFDKKWINKNEYKGTNKAVNNSDTLKSRLNDSINRIDVENRKLDQAVARFQNRGKEIYDKIVDAYAKHDNIRANVYANELAEVRKVEKLIFNLKLTLEQLSLRLKTMTEIGDVAYTLLPVVNVMKGIQSGIDVINPQAVGELDQINNLLSGIIIETGTVTNMNFNFEPINDGSDKILEEAQLLAESRINYNLEKPPGSKSSQKVSSNEVNSETNN
ncbi:hypothetical protein JW865_02535 [Candidatus Bathyarchaeota archaeon]|nr:hypothetical protein [Candidatus Bathyarchaeota archaeon]